MELWNWMLVVLLSPVLFGLCLLVTMALFLVIARRLRNVQRLVTALDHRVRRRHGRSAGARIRAVVQAAEAIEYLGNRMAPCDGMRSGDGLKAVRLEPSVAACRSFAERTRREGRSQESIDAVIRLALHRCIRDDPSKNLQLRILLTPDETARWLNSSAANQS